MAVEIIEPSDALVKVVEIEFELAQNLFVAGDTGDGGSSENGAVDGLGVSLLANGASGIVNRFGGGGQERCDLLENGNGEHKSSHEKGAAASFGDNFNKFSGSDVGV